MIKGISLIVGKGIFHLGSYKRGIWFDNNEILKRPREKRTGWGFKIDLCFGRTIRPIGLLWDREYWNNEETAIRDILENEWDDYFGFELALKLRKLKQFDETRLKHGVCNPWYAKKWFVLRLPKWIPTGFLSFGFGKKWSWYLGNKAYSIDPFTRDLTWTNQDDRDRAWESRLTGNNYFALCPSATSRKTRMT